MDSHAHDPENFPEEITSELRPEKLGWKKDNSKSKNGHLGTGGDSWRLGRDQRRERGRNKATETRRQMKVKALHLHTRPRSAPEGLDLRKIPLAESWRQAGPESRDAVMMCLNITRKEPTETGRRKTWRGRVTGVDGVRWIGLGPSGD